MAKNCYFKQSKRLKNRLLFRTQNFRIIQITLINSNIDKTKHEWNGRV